MKKNPENEPDDKLTSIEQDKLRQDVERLLAQCEAKSPRVYVLEIMRVYASRSRSKQSRQAKVHSAYKSSMVSVIKLVNRTAVQVHPGVTTAHKNVIHRSMAILADPEKIENLGLTGEAIWLRRVDGDELFDTADNTLLLQPRDIQKVHSEFVEQALRQHLVDNWNDARLAVLHAAGESLMNELGEDLALIPDRFSEVVQAVDDVLAGVDWFSLTHDCLICLAEDVVRRVQ